MHHLRPEIYHTSLKTFTKILSCASMKMRSYRQLRRRLIGRLLPNKSLATACVDFAPAAHQHIPGDHQTFLGESNRIPFARRHQNPH